MKKFDVTVPFAGALTICVKAESKKEAINRAMCAPIRFQESLVDPSDIIEWAEIDEWDLYRKLTEGNILYPSCNEVEITATYDE